MGDGVCCGALVEGGLGGYRVRDGGGRRGGLDLLRAKTRWGSRNGSIM